MKIFSFKLQEGAIGWSVGSLSDNGRADAVIDAGVRVFDGGREPRSRESRNVIRRSLRCHERMLKHKKQRKEALRRFLSKHGLRPDFNLDPYRMRVDALDRTLSSCELGCALWSINRRRGQKHSRISENNNDTYSDPNSINISQVMQDEGIRTISEFYYKKLPHLFDRTGRILWLSSPLSKNGYNKYKLRALYEQEFDFIRQKQQQYQKLSDKEWDELKEIIFCQRDIKLTPSGLCRVYYQERLPRADASLPSAQKFNVLNTLYKIDIVNVETGEHRFLTDVERNQLYVTLCHQKTVTLKRIKKILDIEENEVIKINSRKESDRINGVFSSCMLREDMYFGHSWDELPLEEQDYIVNVLTNSQNEKEIYEFFGKYKLPEESRNNLSLIKVAELKKGGSFLSERALREIVPLMEGGLNYDATLKHLGFKESEPKEILDELLYYGYLIPEAIAHTAKRNDKDENVSGIINNPSMHVAINQLRKIVNALIKLYGHPGQIVVEVAKDLKMSAKRMQAIKKERDSREKLNKKTYVDLQELSDNGYDVDYLRDREKYQLWLDLGDIKQCIITGRSISLSALFSGAFVVAHILPLHATLDDSINNKILCAASDYNGYKSIFDLLNNPKSGYEIKSISSRAKRLPDNKSWRFSKDAMESFENETFINRHVNETAQYLSRIISKYLRFVCKNVRVSSGRFTYKAIKSWGLSGVFNEFINAEYQSDFASKMSDRKTKVDINSKKYQENLNKKIKNAEDYRSIAMEAIAISILDHKSILDATIALKDNVDSRVNFSCPFDANCLREQFINVVSKMIVSYRREHSQSGALFEDTIYGVVKDHEHVKQGYSIVNKKPITSIKSLSDIHDVQNKGMRHVLYSVTKDIDFESLDAKERLFSALEDFSKKTGIKSVKMLKKYNGDLLYLNCLHAGVVIPNEVHHVKFWKLDDGSVVGHGYSKIDLRVKERIKAKPGPKAKLIMRLHKSDMISIGEGNNKKFAVVTSLLPSESNKTVFWKNHFSNDKAYQASFMFDKVLEKNIKLVNVDVLGKIKE